MARPTNRLSALEVKKLGAGFHADGGGLYLRVDDQGGRRWVFMFKRAGRRHEMGLGPLAKSPLSTAREEARQARLDLGEAKDPISERRRRRGGDAPTFGEFADELVKTMRPSWKNPVHAAQWVRTVEKECAALRPLRLPQIGTDDVLAALKPLWQAKPESARRTRGRIEFILDAAKARGHRARDTENPARWRGHLDKLLPKRNPATKTNHPAVPYAKARDFFADMRKAKGVAAAALEFTILTASRSSEVALANKDEIDLAQGVWNIPAARMKKGKSHRVPLSPRALEIARKQVEGAKGKALFPGLGRPDRGISNNAMRKQLQNLGWGQYTVHGFRSTFRDWAADRTVFPREVVEFCLAHVEGSEAEKAYWRSDVLERRREVMESWALFCEPGAGNVIKIA